MLNIWKEIAGLLFITDSNPQFCIIYLPKIVSTFNGDSEVEDEFISGTMYDACSNVSPITISVGHALTNHKQLARITDESSTAKGIAVTPNPETDNNVILPEGADAVHIIRIPRVIPITHEHGVKAGNFKSLSILQSIREYHPLLTTWSDTMVYSMSGDNGVTHLTIKEVAMTPPNPKDNPIEKQNPGCFVNQLEEDGEEYDRIFISEIKDRLNIVQQKNLELCYLEFPGEDPSTKQWELEKSIRQQVAKSNTNYNLNNCSEHDRTTTTIGGEVRNGHSPTTSLWLSTNLG